jgi:hypothetical protein
MTGKSLIVIADSIVRVESKTLVTQFRSDPSVNAQRQRVHHGGGGSID